MIRLIVLLVVAVLLPFVIHGLVTLARDRDFRPLPSEPRGRLWLVVFGLLLAFATLVSLMNDAPHALGERYVPTHMEGPILVPGKFVPE